MRGLAPKPSTSRFRVALVVAKRPVPEQQHRLYSFPSVPSGIDQCGLIVLLERPYLVGDVVTVGDNSGIVTRIQIRATTIIDWDGREIIVPNKEFITGKLINWSLSDPITRLVIPVGVVYGSDTDLAGELLFKVSRENPYVVDQPEPTAYFLGFGDNSLNFDLRVFIKNVTIRFFVPHQLHMAIDREFRKAGIVIASPQRDVHLDSVSPVDVRIASERTKGADQHAVPHLVPDAKGRD